MNRMGLGLAVGAGYVLGRTKKMKMAVALGSLVAGKRLNLTPRAVADLVSGQLKDNPQLKGVSDELRQDLRGVGKAASGALVERQIEALADRLHGRTAEVRERLAGEVPGKGGGNGEAEQEADEPEDTAEDTDEDSDATDEESEEGDRPAAKKAARKAPTKKTAQSAPAKKAPAKKAPARKAAGKKTAGARKTAARTASRAGQGAQGRKGGGDR